MLVPLPSLLQMPVTLDHHHPWPAGQWFEVNSPQHHTLILFRSQGQVSCQIKVKEHPPRPEVYGGGSLCLIPAGVAYGVRADQPLQINLFHFPTNLLEITAITIGLGNNLELPLNLCIQDPTLYHLAMALATDVKVDPSTDGDYSEVLLLALARYLVQHYGGCRRLFQPIAQSFYKEWQQLLIAQSLLQQSYPNPGVETVRGQSSPYLTPANSSSEGVATAIAWLNQLFIDNLHCPLSDMEMRLVTGVLQGEDYRQVAVATRRSIGHIKTLGSGLWKQLSEVTGQPIRKSNLRSYLQCQGLSVRSIPARVASVSATQVQASVRR